MKRQTAFTFSLWLVTVMLAAAVAVPSQAFAAEVTIQNPVQGQEYPVPYDGPLTVDFTGAPADTYTLTVSGPSYLWEADHIYDGTNHTFSQNFTTITSPGTFTASVKDSTETEIASVTFMVAEDEATIVSPSSGNTLFAPFSGPIRVRWDSIADPGSSYEVDVERNGSFVDGCSYGGSDLEDTTTSCSISVGNGTYDVLVYNADVRDILDHITFSVVPHLRLTGVSVNPDTFFPLVRDGFRDTTRVAFRTNKTSRNRIRIVSRSTNRTVRRVDFGSQSSGSHSWRWNGRNNTGRVVEPGSYRIEVIVGASGETRTASRSVRVRTRVLRKYFTKSKRGTGYSSRGRRGNCNFDSFQGEALLTCYFGVAWVDYRWNLAPPRSLRNIVRGPIPGRINFRYRNGLTRCHPRIEGEVRRGRRAVTRFISNGSNGWSQCWVSSAHIRYHYLYRQ